MLFTLLLLVSTDLPNGDTILLQEQVAPALVVKTHGRSTEQVATTPLSWGKNGWGFDVDLNCNVFVVQSVGNDHTDRLNTRLVFYRRGDFDAGTVLATSENGLSSPTVSPDGGQVLMIRGADELVRLDIVDGGEIAIGKAWFANWEADGTFAAYSRTDAGCHVLRHFSTALSPDRSVTQCQGFTVLPIGGGLIPSGSPIPVIDRHRNLIGLLGIDGLKSGPVQLSTAERGAACKAGVDFVASDGGAVTLRKSQGSWSIETGSSCVPIELRRGFVKAIECRAR
jgi:hypothetical protein